MKRRHLLVLPALAFMPTPARASFGSECQEGVTGPISRFCRQCHNLDCNEARQPLTKHLRLLQERVLAAGLRVWYIHVGSTRFLELARENGLSSTTPPGVEYQTLKLWDDPLAVLYGHDDAYYQDRVNIYAYPPGSSPSSKRVEGAVFTMRWSDIRGYRMNVTWDNGATFHTPVEF